MKWSRFQKAFRSFRSNVMVRREFYLLIAIRFGITLVTYTVPAVYKAFGLMEEYEGITQSLNS